MGKLRIGGNSFEGPFRLLFTGNNSHWKIAGLFEGAKKLLLIECIASGARGNNFNRPGIPFSSFLNKLRNSLGRLLDGLRLQPVSFIESTAEAGLLALFKNWLDGFAFNNADQKFY